MNKYVIYTKDYNRENDVDNGAPVYMTRFIKKGPNAFSGILRNLLFQITIHHRPIFVGLSFCKNMHINEFGPKLLYRVELHFVKVCILI